jgi:hypothetical protein
MPPVTFRKRVVRRDDLISLELEFLNLSLSDDGSRLSRADPHQPAFLIVHFPPQHIAEQAYLENEDGTPSPGPVPANALLSGPSRLAFKLPDGVDEVPYRLQDLMDWGKFDLSVPPNALPPGATTGPAPAPLAGTETALELPYRLFLSPDSTETWVNAAEPVTHDGRTELWHTRLARRGQAGTQESGTTLRAVGFRDTHDPFKFILPQRNFVDQKTGEVFNQLGEIVRLSSDFSIRPERPPLFPPQHFREQLRAWGIPVHYIPRPVEVERMMLSTLGGWARLSSEWDYPTVQPNLIQMLGMPVFSLEQWQHVASMGRDQYVRVVSKGFACPTGHRLSLLQVVERKFSPTQVRTENTPQGPVAIFGNIAYLRYYKIIVVQEPEKDYTAYADAYQSSGREMMFRKIRLTTLVTPKLDSDTFGWVRSDEQDVMFAAIAEDWAGHPVSLSIPLMFVPYPLPDKIDGTAIQNTFMEDPPSRHRYDLNNQVVAFAPSIGDSTITHLKTAYVDIKLQMPPDLKAGNLPANYPVQFLPALNAAGAEIPAVTQLLGRADPVEITLHPAFLDHGMEGPNAKAVAFVALTNPVKLNFAADKAGGLAKPDMGVNGVTRVMGAVASVDTVVSGTVDTSAFKDAELLGGIKIGDILEAATFSPADFDPGRLTPEALADPNVLVKVPVLTTRRTATAIETHYVWKPAIHNFEPLLKTTAGQAENGFDEPARLLLDATLTKPLDGSEGGFRINGRFTHFALDFAGALKVKFAKLSFLAEQGKKPDVSADGVELTFEGPLAFVNTLKNILPSKGFSDPPFLDVDASGIVAGYSLGVPSVGVGIFSLQNIALGAALSVPFVSKPAGVRFTISERQHPFIVTVGLFGGGGFFALAVSSRGLEQIEAAIEFGGNISLNLGVASGGVYVMAGIYFNKTQQSVALTGYLRCGGYLEVLGLISISIEFYLAFTYRDKGGGRGEVWGQASVTVCVEVACFSKSVTLTVERRFAGAASDPAFEQLVEPDDWAEYCLAFA